jgi:nucleoside-diphosphate-sugar epimerase
MTPPNSAPWTDAAEAVPVADRVIEAEKAGSARIVVVGATGNVGTSLIEVLSVDPKVASIAGVARRAPKWRAPKTSWVTADIHQSDLVSIFEGADAVVALGWLFQPTRDPASTWRANVLGNLRVFDAVAEAKVPILVYASSVGAYSPGPKDRRVDEDWPTNGWPGAAYTREKAYVERVLDTYERDHPDVRVVRMRPGFIFKRRASEQQRRLFGGPFVPNKLVRPRLLPIVPDIPGLRFQILHTSDAAEAYRLALWKPVRGAFNLAADPVVDPDLLGAMFDAKPVRMPAWPARAALAAAWRLHAVPATAGLFDAVLRVPLMDTDRARTELGWTPAHSARDALQEFLRGLRETDDLPTPPLRAEDSRIREFTTGVGGRP